MTHHNQTKVLTTWLLNVIIIKPMLHQKQQTKQNGKEELRKAQKHKNSP
jgi:hypothetical protein